jgi:uroporphyrinogen III methyltransferase/synthase
VRLRDKLNWYERLPLFGKQIVVTRARGQAEALSGKLRGLGASVIDMPTIEIAPAADYNPLDRAIAELGAYDWLIFTSANGVHYFMERLDRSRSDLRALRARICAIGLATKGAIEALHLKVDMMGEEYVAESMIEAFRSVDLHGQRVLLPRAAVARDLLPRELRLRGACVDVVEAYHTVLPADAEKKASEIFIEHNRPDWITFTSSSTVQNFIRIAGARALSNVKVASIGPVTTATANKLGVQVTVEARVYTTDGLVQAILDFSRAV